ncbi:MAG: hypothetical protein K9W42_06695 [Candidatus Heimdallarchaeota archaeon]|nr:hypothetical protein [Candidatus Heimdallarchaeota archaeon]
MKKPKILKSRKGVSTVLATIFLIGITVASVGFIYSMLSSYTKFNSKVDAAGVVEVTDYDNDGLIDSIALPLTNKGMKSAVIESVNVVQNDQDHLWFTFDTEVKISAVEKVNLYALSSEQQIQFFIPFHVEITFEDENYVSPGYIISNSDEVPTEILPTIIEGGDPSFSAFDLLVSRTADDAAYGKKKFPTDIGYSPTRWFILGEFEDNNKRPDLSTDFIALCGHGNELAFTPYLMDERTFTNGNIGTQSSQEVIPYEDGGDHPGLIALNKYGKWDKEDDLNWGKYGIVYMWSYIYVPGTDAIPVSIGANGASEFKVYLNGEFQVEGHKKKQWYTNDGVILNAGLNLVLLKISAKTNAHFAGQVLFYNNANLAACYSVWPTINDL